MRSLQLPLHTSASQLSMYSRCPRQYRFRYVNGLEPESKSIALVLGTVTHSAIGWFYEQRMQGNDAGYEEVVQIMGADLLAELTGAKIDWGESAEKQHSRINACLLEFLQQFGHLPVTAVEQRVELEREGRPLIGYLDLVLEDGTAVELKTSARKYSEHDLNNSIQFLAYRHVMRVTGGKGLRLIAMVKTRKPQLQDIFLEPATTVESKWFEELVADIETAIASGIYPPSPGQACGYCDFKQQCRGGAS